MTESLLATKFYIPSIRPKLVPRQQLVECINEGLYRKLTLISAPAGYGKTTLAIEWIRQLDMSAAWIALDEADNDAKRFILCLITALNQIDEQVGEIARLIMNRAHSISDEMALTALINEIASRSTQFIIVFDDYHVIENSEIHNQIAFILDHQPPNLHLVITTREDPILPISRLRGRGQVTEIRMADLKFSRSDSTVFFNDLLTLGLGSDDIASLTSRTEGWVAGLQLAALSLKSTQNKSEFIKAFAGSHRFLTDYLVDEVLSTQSEEIQSFLYRTSILDQFSVELCDLLIESKKSRSIINQLEQANLFLIAVDQNRTWYRYHHLFAEFLRIRLIEEEAYLVEDLYQRVILWFEKEGLYREALNYALKAENFGKAVELMENLAPKILEQENHMLLIHWCEKLPDELLSTRPYLCVFLVWAYLIAGQLEKAGNWLELIEKSIEQIDSDDTNILKGYIAAHRAYIAVFTGNNHMAVEYSNFALKMLPENEKTIRARTITNLGNANIYLGNLEEAKRAFQEVINISKETGNLSLALYSYCSLGEVYFDEGRLSDSENTYQAFLDYSEELTGEKHFPLTGYAVYEKGVIALERFELDRALDLIHSGSDLCREWYQGKELAIGLIELSETYRFRKEYHNSEQTLNEARQIANKISPWVKSLVDSYTVRLKLSQGRIKEAEYLIKQMDKDHANDLGGYEQFWRAIPKLRLFIATGETEKALSSVESMIDRDRKAGRKSRLAELLVIKASALAVHDDSEKILEILQETLRIAESEKAVRPFIDEGKRILPYLEKLPKTDFLRNLIGIISGDEQSSSDLQQVHSVEDETFSDREISILKLISAGNSNQDIASELFLSVNTIRWYARQIYSKLGVKNRSAAVARARELDLI